MYVCMYVYNQIIMCKIMRSQKFLWQNIIKSNKSQTSFVYKYKYYRL